jgi:hypothetical protein
MIEISTLYILGGNFVLSIHEVRLIMVINTGLSKLITVHCHFVLFDGLEAGFLVQV